MAYTYSKKITIDHTKVAGSADFSNFPFLFKGTYAGSGSDPDLRSVANGGKIQNVDTTSGASNAISAPADFAFYSDQALTTALDFEVEKYVATTGEIICWVRIPTLDYDNNTVIYLAYGDAAITTSRENIGATWATQYKAVWHLNSYLHDSSGNGNTLTNNNSTPFASAKIADGIDIELSSSHNLSISDNTYVSPTGDLVLQCIARWESTPSGEMSIFGKYQTGGNADWLLMWNGAVNQLQLYVSSSGNYETQANSSSFVPTTGVDYKIDVRYDASAGTVYFYVNGSLHSTATSIATSIHNGSGVFRIGAYNATAQGFFDGLIDESRLIHDTGIADTYTADWFSTEYENWFNTSSFYSISNVFTTSSVTKSLGYTIKKSYSNTKSLNYKIKKPYSITKSIEYRIYRTIAAITKSLEYVIAPENVIIKSLQYLILLRSGITKSLAYKILLDYSITKQLAYSVLTDTALTKSLTYKIYFLGQITKSMQYIIAFSGLIQKTMQYEIGRDGYIYLYPSGDEDSEYSNLYEVT